MLVANLRWYRQDGIGKAGIGKSRVVQAAMDTAGTGVHLDAVENVAGRPARTTELRGGIGRLRIQGVGGRYVLFADRSLISPAPKRANVVVGNAVRVKFARNVWAAPRGPAFRLYLHRIVVRHVHIVTLHAGSGGGRAECVGWIRVVWDINLQYIADPVAVGVVAGYKRYGSRER